MKKPETPTTELAPADAVGEVVAEPELVLLKPHRHGGKQYFAGHVFTQSEWGLSEREMGFLQAHGVI